MSSSIKIIECPRDAMQGLKEFVPSELKAEYINKLLNVGFDTLDFGSFVSPKAIPQMKDTKEVLSQLDLSNTSTKLLAIVANQRGAVAACEHPEIQYLGYPFSVSETFQQRNTNIGIQASFERVQDIQALCLQHGKQLVVYLSMAFGNPYGDPWSTDLVLEYAGKLHQEGIQILALSDTTGVSTPSSITALVKGIQSECHAVELGSHFHTRADQWKEKVTTAYAAGCRRFDGAILGYGGCPFAADNLVGNMPTENLLHFFKEEGVALNLNEEAFGDAMKFSNQIFPA